MTEIELEVFEEFKEFLQDLLNGDISNGDSIDYLCAMAEKLNIVEQ